MANYSAAARSDLPAQLFVDISQNHIRRPLSNADGTVRALLTSTDLYHFGTDRCLVPLEHLLLQGYSPDVVLPDLLSDSDVRQMAGEAIFLPCLATVLWCLNLTKDLTEL